MPWTIYRYILREMLKLLVITTGVLVMVISFAAAIKPLSDGMLGPMALAKFVLYTAPTMLGFVLPFAGAFAATLVFLRMAADNEIVACSAGGMSYRTILLPVLGLGLVLMMGLFFLSNFVVPSFYRKAAQTLEEDLMTVLVSQLNENRPFRRGNVVIYADHASNLDPPHLPDAAIQPSRYVKLEHVAVGQLNKEGTFSSDSTAQEAHVLLFHDQEQSYVTIRLFNAMYYDPVDGQIKLGGAKRLDSPTIRLPNYFADKPKFLSWPQLSRLGREPQRNHKVQELKDKLASALARENLRSQLLELLGSGQANQTVHFAGPGPGEQYELSAHKAWSDGKKLILAAAGEQPVVLQYRAPDWPGRRFEAQSATLMVLDSAQIAQPTVGLRLENVRVINMQAGSSTQRQEYTSPRLVWPEALLPKAAKDLSVAYLIDQTKKPTYADSKPVLDAATKLIREQKKLIYRIIGHLNERAASSIACLGLLLLGASLSMMLKDQMPLVVFFWSFMLAIISIIIMNSGQNMAGNPDIPRLLSLGALWSGNGMLLITLIAIYQKLAKN